MKPVYDLYVRIWLALKRLVKKGNSRDDENDPFNNPCLII